MKSLLCTVFRWTPERAQEYIGNTDNDDDVFTRLLDSPEPPIGVSPGLFYRATPVLKQKRLKYVLREWAEAKKHGSILDQLSLFELETVCHINPFYLMFAFNVPFDDCCDVIRRRKMVLSKDIIAHATLVAMISQHNSVYVHLAHQELEKRGIVVAAENRLDAVLPFPRDHFATHPLRDHDPDTVTSAALKAKVANPTEIISYIRERKFMTNRVVVIDGKYKLRTLAFQFVKELNDIRDRAIALEPRIRQEYKRLKQREEKS